MTKEELIKEMLEDVEQNWSNANMREFALGMFQGMLVRADRETILNVRKIMKDLN